MLQMAKTVLHPTNVIRKNKCIFAPKFAILTNKNII